MIQKTKEQDLRILVRKQRVKERMRDRLPKNMAKMEARLVKLEQRVKRIEENPDPSKPAANKIMYKLEANEVRRLIEAWKTENPPFIGSRTAPVRAMGFMPWAGTIAAIRSTPEEAKRYFDVMERQAFNENACDLTITTIPMVLAGEYPPPDVLTTTQWECFPIYQAYQSLADLLGIPLLAIDRPPVYDERALTYVTRQIKEEIDYLESMYPGHKYNEAILKESQEISRIWWGYQRDIYELRKRKPCPIAGIETFREPVGPAGAGAGGDDAWAGLEYARLYRDQLYENAEKGNVPSKIWGTEEKLRLAWTVSGPFYFDPFTFLDKLGVSVPCWIISSLYEKASGRERIISDPEFGRTLSPLEEVAKGVMEAGWGYRSDYYVNSIISTSRDLECDGIVYFKQPGCTPTMSLGGIVSERAEHELGIPTLELEGRQLDQRGFNRGDLLTKLVEFSNMCLARKHLPPLTRTELEKAGYYE